MEGSIAIMKQMRKRERGSVTDSKVRRTTEGNFLPYYARFYPTGHAISNNILNKKNDLKQSSYHQLQLKSSMHSRCCQKFRFYRRLRKKKKSDHQNPLLPVGVLLST